MNSNVEKSSTPTSSRTTALAALVLAGCSGGGSGGGESDASTSAADASGSVDAAARADAMPPDAGLPPGTYMLQTGDETMVTRGQSAGGSLYQIACQSDEVAVGIIGRADESVHAASLVCAELLSDGSLGDERQPGLVPGGDGGVAFEETCPAGQAMVSIRGREGAGLLALGIECASVPWWIDRGITRAASGDLHGASTGEDFLDVCAARRFVRGIQGLAGDEIQTLRGWCSRVVNSDDPDDGTYVASGAQVEIDAQGETVAAPAGLTCGGGDLVQALLGHVDDRLRSLGLRCHQLQSDGNLAQSGEATALAGTETGDMYVAGCGLFDGLVGLEAWTDGSGLRGFRLHCADPALWVRYGEGTYPWGARVGAQAGASVLERCPPAHIVRAVKVHEDGAIVGVRLACERIDRTSP